MAAVLAAWLWVWVCVFIATAMPVTRIPNYVTQGFCERNQGTATTVSTEIVCAMLCVHRMAKKYTFSGTSCTLFGTTTLPTSAITTFHYFYSPDTLEDKATGKPTTASSVFNDNYEPPKAVDTDQSSMFHSGEGDMTPWWQLDLGEIRTIHEIQILPHSSFGKRFHDVEIYVGEVRVTNGDFSSYTLFAKYTGPYTPSQGHVHLSCTSVNWLRGRWVAIKKVKATAANPYLEIADVKAFVLK